MKEEQALIFELSRPGRVAYDLPDSTCPQWSYQKNGYGRSFRSSRGIRIGFDSSLHEGSLTKYRRRSGLLSARIVHHEI